MAGESARGGDFERMAGRGGGDLDRCGLLDNGLVLLDNGLVLLDDGFALLDDGMDAANERVASDLRGNAP